MAFVANPNGRRVIIVDFAHMAWSYAFSNAKALSHTLMVDGVPRVVDTTIPTYTIKALNRWAKCGFNPLAVCFDGRGNARCRKAYFAANTDPVDGGQVASYKGQRDNHDSRLYEGINMTAHFLLEGGVSCYKAENYEADDLVKACVDRAKIDYPDLPIDIFTGDHDLLPLVDEQVSVFLRSVKTTYAESKELEKPHYVQVTPRNFQSYLETLTSYKSLQVPYNTVLLAKLLRGDKSDAVPGMPAWKPKKYKDLLAKLEADGVDLGSLFRYDNPTEKIIDTRTNKELSPTDAMSVANEFKYISFGEPPALTRICDTLAPYVTEEDIAHIRYVYNGINLNGAFTDIGDFTRRPAKLATPIKGYDVALLAGLLSKTLSINLPISM